MTPLFVSCSWTLLISHLDLGDGEIKKTNKTKATLSTLATDSDPNVLEKEWKVFSKHNSYKYALLKNWQLAAAAKEKNYSAHITFLFIVTNPHH